MSYPFKITDNHKTYKVTFLQSAILKLEYDAANESFALFSEFFENIFHLKLIEQKFNLKNTDAIRLRSDNNAYRAKFSKNNIEIIVNGNAYVNYKESLLPFVSQISDYLCKINGDILGASIEKIDIWPLVKGRIDSSEDFIKAIISQDLRNCPDLTSDKDGSFVEFRDTDFGDSLLIRYCFIPFIEELKDQPARIVLDTLCQHNAKKIKPTDLPETVRRLNGILYDAYHWSVEEDVIKIMES